MNGLRVLLVVADESLRQRVEVFLLDRGHDVIPAASTEQSLAKMATQSFDLLVVEGPSTDSGRAIELIRRARVTLPNMASIFLASEISRQTMLQAVRAHVFDIIQLPLDQNLFALALDRAAERVRLVYERDHLLESLKNRNTDLEVSLAKLHEAYERLMMQEELLEADLRRAQLMQLNLLPEAFPSKCGMEFFGFYSPSDRLGGDFFGYLPLGPDKLAVYLADVSGHGVRAAMVTVIVRELLHSQLLLHPGEQSILANPTQALQFLNRGLLEENFDSPVHATMVYAVVDSANGKLSYCRAGHPAPVLCSQEGHLSRLHTGGPGVGLEPMPIFSSQTISLNPGGTCLFFSDGVTQAMGFRDEDTAASALGRILRGVRERSAPQIGERIERSALGMSQDGVVDDISFLIIRRPVTEAQTADEETPSVKVVAVHSSNNHSALPESRVEMGWEDAICVVRLVGPLTWQLGGAFQEVVEESREARAVVCYVDISECESLDSTMLGLINRYANDLVLSSPSERVDRQILELGLAKRVHLAKEPPPEVNALVRISPEMSREQRAQMMLEAHESLQSISEANRDRFEGVVRSLRNRQSGD